MSSACPNAVTRLALLSAEANRLVANSVADNSKRSLQPGVNAYVSFCALHNICPESPSAEDIVLFAADLGKSRSVASVRVYLAAVRYHLLCKGMPVEHLRSARLTAVLKGLERQRSSRPHTC